MPLVLGASISVSISCVTTLLPSALTRMKHAVRKEHKYTPDIPYNTLETCTTHI